MNKDVKIGLEGLIFNTIALGAFVTGAVIFYNQEKGSSCAWCVVLAIAAFIFSAGFYKTIELDIQHISKPEIMGRLMLFDGEDDEKIGLGLQLTETPEEFMDKPFGVLEITDMRKTQKFKAVEK